MRYNKARLRKLQADGNWQLYFDQAEKYGPLLNIKVAQKKTAAGPVAMVNKPLFTLRDPRR